MLCVYLQTFEAALFWKKKKKNSAFFVNSNFKDFDLCRVDFIQSRLKIFLHKC